MDELAKSWLPGFGVKTYPELGEMSLACKLAVNTCGLCDGRQDGDQQGDNRILKDGKPHPLEAC